MTHRHLSDRFLLVVVGVVVAVVAASFGWLFTDAFLDDIPPIDSIETYCDVTRRVPKVTMRECNAIHDRALRRRCLKRIGR